MAQTAVPPTQLPLGVDYRTTVEAAGTRLLAAIGEAIGLSGKQGDDFAADLGVDPGQFSRALAGRGTHFSAKWIPAVIWRDRDRRLIRHLCAMAGGEFVETARLTPEQKLERLERALRDAGVFGDAVIRAAYGEEQP